MNRLKASLHAVNLAVRTVKLADAVKKTAIIVAIGVCCFMLIKEKGE